MRSVCIALLSLVCCGVAAQFVEPVKFTTALEEQNETIVLRFAATIDKGWHVYATDLPKGGPIPTTLTIETIEGLRPATAFSATTKPIETFEPLFDMTVKYYTQRVVFTQSFKPTGGAWRLAGYLTYSACNDESCLPPTNVEFTYTGEGQQAAPLTVSDTTANTPPQQDSINTWLPVIYNNAGTQGADTSLWSIFIAGLIGGLLALLTPCVWPMIPLTVSMFIKRADTKRQGVGSALLYSASIIAIYVALGLAVTLAFGANALNELSTSAAVNIFFAALLVVFALSFFGLFELSLPSSWSSSVSNKSRSMGGIAGIFLMAGVLAITSFSCTGPIIGFLLVEAAGSGGMLAPLLGMTGFAIAIALPFGLLAFSPGTLKRMPKSGRWMQHIKVVLGVIEVAFAFKFLSVADLAHGWGILDREYFLIAWLLLALGLGVYFWCTLMRYKIVPVLACLACAVYLVPGLWGQPLTAISAFTPPMSTQTWYLNEPQHIEAQFTDYDEALAYARSTGKRVLIDFTGYGCVNCRKMEAAVWTRPEVARALAEDYILVSLYVDSREPIERIEKQEEGRTTVLRTVGDKWSYLQRHKFHANAQPFYVKVDGAGNLLGGDYYTYDENVQHFLQFLKD